MVDAEAELRDRLARVAETVDSLLVTGRANVRYLTGFSGSSGWALWHRGELSLLTDPRYAAQARVECPTTSVLVSDRGLAPLLTDAIGDDAVGFEPEHTTVSDLAALQRQCPHARFVETGGTIEALRLRKSESEIARIRAALAVAEAAAPAAVSAANAGATEAGVAAALDHACRVGGASEMSFETIVATGGRSALPHARPTQQTIDPATPLQLDWGCRVDGYCSDVSRVIAPFPGTGRWKAVHRALEAAILAACSTIRAGQRAAAADAAARAALAERGLAEYFLHGLGHGVGLEVHERPRLSARSDEVLQEGMVVTVEPGVYVAGAGGMRLENMVVVREAGCEVLNALGLGWGGWLDA